MTMRLAAAGVAAIALLGGWKGLRTRSAEATQSQLPMQLLAAPPTTGSTQPNLSVDDAGNVYLIWLQRTEGAETSIRFSKLDGRSWSEPRIVASGRGLVASSADIPSLIVLPGGRLAAHWLQVSETNSRSYGVRIAQSTDMGVTWSAPITPHASHAIGENGFVSLFARGDSLGVTWLDGRNFAPGGKRETMLLTTGVSRSGSIASEVTLDTRVCDCCQTAYANTMSGPVIAYRERSADDIRDIAVVRHINGRWTEPTIVHRDGWNIRSCPVNGPALAARGNELAVAWFTAARDTSKVLVSFSKDGGASFAAPSRVDAGDPVGRVSVALASDGVWVSWLERLPQGKSQIRVRKVSASGTSSPAYTIGPPDLTFATGFPQMVAARSGLVIAWTSAAEVGAPPKVNVALLQPPAR